MPPRFSAQRTTVHINEQLGHVSQMLDWLAPHLQKLLAALDPNPKQLYSLEDLVKRYSFSIDVVREMLGEIGVKGEKGRRLRVHVTDVHRLDAIVRERFAAGGERIEGERRG